jgi:hypothetical protein
VLISFTIPALIGWTTVAAVAGAYLHKRLSK